MDVVHQRCCGLDVHKKKVVACAITPEGRETRIFTTMTPDLLAMGDWLAACGVTHVAMESTGVLWKPIFNLLEDSFILPLKDWWSTPTISRWCLGGRLTSMMPSGLRTCCGMDWCGAVLFRVAPNGSSGSWCGTAGV